MWLQFVSRLTKHAKSAIASAAGELIRSWKATVTKEAAAKATADKPTVGVEVKEEQEAPVAPNVPTTPTATPSTGDAARDKLAVSLGDALAKVVEELGADAAGLADPAMVTSHCPSARPVVRIEEPLHDTAPLLKTTQAPRTER